MKNAFKKVAVVIVAFMLISLCSCSNADSTMKDNSVKPTSSDGTTKDNNVKPTYTPATYEKNVSGNDVFSNGWYSESLDIHTKVKVSKLDPSKGVTWKVYFTEELLSEEEIEKLKEREPDIIDSGEIDASKYNWIYVYCSINSTTSPEPTSDMLKISYQTQ